MRMLFAALAIIFALVLAQPGRAESWPASWKARPSADLVREMKAAAREFEVPVLLLLAIAYVETGGTFKTQIRGKKHAGNNERFAESYRTRSDEMIPGSTITWGEKFAADDWRPYGALQVNPYHLWGVTLPAEAPLEAGYDIRANARAAAKVLRDAYATGGSWLAAIRRYNAKSAFRTLVLRAYRTLGGNLTQLEAVA